MNNNSHDEAPELLLEVVEAIIHVIIGSRGIYPKESFSKRQLYGVPVYMSRHPELCVYISTVLANARPLLPNLDLIVIGICDSLGDPLEAHCFELMPSAHDGQREDINADSLLYDIEAQMRDLLLRAMALEWQRPPLPKGCCFNLQLRTTPTARSQDAIHGLQSGRWLLASGGKLEQMITRGGITPIRAVSSKGMNFQFLTVSLN